MVLITFTNIIVDDFNYGKKNPLKKYIYFLTHMHSGTANICLHKVRYFFFLKISFTFCLDHYGGITPGWNFGKIYCSITT